MNLKTLSKLLSTIAGLLVMLGWQGTPEEIITAVFDATAAAIDGLPSGVSEPKQILGIAGAVIASLAPDAKLVGLNPTETADLQKCAADVGKLLTDFAGVTTPAAG